MGTMQKCNECHKPVAGIANLFLGEKGPRLCVDCVVKLQMESDAPTALSFFVGWYLKRLADAKVPSRIEVLETRIRYLETELGVQDEPAVSFATPNSVTHITTKRSRRGRR